MRVSVHISLIRPTLHCQQLQYFIETNCMQRHFRYNVRVCLYLRIYIAHIVNLREAFKHDYLTYIHKYIHYYY